MKYAFYTLGIVTLSWVLLSLIVAYINSKREQEISYQLSEYWNSENKESFEVKEFIPLVFYSWTNFETTCSGYTLELQKSLTSLAPSFAGYVPEPFFSFFKLFPRTVQKIKIYKNNQLIFSDWIRENSILSKKIKFKKSYYEYEFKDEFGEPSSNVPAAYHLVLPSEIKMSKEEFESLSQCFLDNNLTNIFTYDLTSIPEAEKHKYYFSEPRSETEKAFATRNVDKNLILHDGISTFILLD